jgi:hypothetical protein
MASETERPKLEIVHEQLDASESTNPFANLDALRNPQDYEEFMNGEAVTGFAVRTLKEGLHLRVRPGAEYSLLGQYTVETKKAGVYFVYPQFREALGPLPRRCNLHVAVDGHGEYFLLRIKQQNPDKDENEWYRTARVVAAAAMEGWIRVTKLKGDSPLTNQGKSAHSSSWVAGSRAKLTIDLVAHTSADRRPVDDPSVTPRKLRSKITNGSVLVPGVDQRSPWVRRCKDVIASHLSDLGGLDNTSAAERSIIRRASCLTVELERLEGRFAAANEASDSDLDLYQRTAGNLRRLLEAVGLQRRSKEVGGLSLGDLMRLDIEDRRREAASAPVIDLGDPEASGAEAISEAPEAAEGHTSNEAAT